MERHGTIRSTRLSKFSVSILGIARCLTAWAIAANFCSTTLAQTLQMSFVDQDTGDPIACRVEFTKSPKRFPKPRDALVSGATILFEEAAKLKPPPGDYELRVSRGIEFSEVEGGFGIEKNSPNQFEVVVPHLTKMNEENWFSGDLSTKIPSEHLARWAAAEALNMAVRVDALASSANSAPLPIQPADAVELVPAAQVPSISTSYWLSDAQTNVPIVIHPTKQVGSVPVELTGLNAGDVQGWCQAISQIDRDDWLIELTDIWKRDLPIILANTRIDAVQVLGGHLQPEAELNVSEAFYNPDKLRFARDKALGRLVEFIYWQMLEAGLRVAPTAGSEFRQDGKTFVGYNRMYVYVDPQQEKTPEQWWNSCRNGFSIITNGPLLRVKVNGSPPGAIVSSYSGQQIPLNLYTDLTVRDEVDYLDVVFNGKTLYQARLEDHRRRGAFPALAISESGWLVIRVVTSHGKSYRLATTSPTYYEFDGKPRISRSAVQFFQAWLAEGKKEISQDPKQSERYEQAIKVADRYWANQAINATAP